MTEWQIVILTLDFESTSVYECHHRLSGEHVFIFDRMNNQKDQVIIFPLCMMYWCMILGVYIVCICIL